MKLNLDVQLSIIGHFQLNLNEMKPKYIHDSSGYQLSISQVFKLHTYLDFFFFLRDTYLSRCSSSLNIFFLYTRRPSQTESPPWTTESNTET